MKKLLLVGGHIGNPKDMSRRAVEELAQADMVLCERAYFFGMLLEDLGITTNAKIVELADITTETKQEIVDFLKNDKSVVLISDAGLPMIADPGIEISQFLFKNGLDIDIVPGPSIVSTAHVISAVDPFSSSFLFHEFMLYDTQAIAPSLEKLKSLPHTLVILDRPDRFVENLEICLSVFGNRNGSVLVSVTEPEGRVIRGSLRTLLEYCKDNDLSRNMLTLVIAGNHSIDWKTLG
jgi:16S rRNA (cytidine1402-2'-O)-methyltransferase